MKKRPMLAIILALLVVPVAGASATTEPYVLVVWEAPGGPSDTFAVPQTLVASQVTSSTSLDALDGVLQCETTYQIDLYANDQTTGALVAGGVLISPGNPRESWPGGHYTKAYSKVVTTADCPVVEPPVDPPVNPPVDPPVDPPVEPPVAPPVAPPVNPPVEPAPPALQQPRFTG